MSKRSRSRMNLRVRHNKVASKAPLDKLSHKIGKKRRLRARFEKMGANQIADIIAAKRCKSTKIDNYEVEDFIVVDVGTEAVDEPVEELVEASVEEPVDEPICWKENLDMGRSTNKKNPPWIWNPDSNYDSGVLDNSSQAISETSLAESTQSRTLGIKLRHSSPDSGLYLTENPCGNFSSSMPCVNDIPRYRGLNLGNIFLSHVQLICAVAHRISSDGIQRNQRPFHKQQFFYLEWWRFAGKTKRALSSLALCHFSN
ncbi:hypothetical protein OIDMADRAFT_48909 [Oidiodendron maius Zn]|uniref:Uncharacterized protein n=1 Tax=Oidiodendron maius (strain Zn) TaxID=913774 RepID=A0A0C3HLH6_OIDMZ|nr:hypothetical protein OIDMADRAFT_48909 [Oidiodendron maius Zn]